MSGADDRLDDHGEEEAARAGDDEAEGLVLEAELHVEGDRRDEGAGPETGARKEDDVGDHGALLEPNEPGIEDPVELEVVRPNPFEISAETSEAHLGALICAQGHVAPRVEGGARPVVLRRRGGGGGEAEGEGGDPHRSKRGTSGTAREIRGHWRLRRPPAILGGLDFLTPLGPGDRLGSYTIVRRLGEGGMGVVFEARHDRTQRPAAVKVLSSWLVTELGRARFEREVQACASLTHPNTIEIYDFGESDDGTLYFAMEYLEGYDLGELVKMDGPLPVARTLRIVDQIAGALGEAHEKGLVHRDIKPANIILCEAGGIPDIAKLVDFGLVSPMIQSDRRRLTAEGQLIGTPRYVAPEMLRAKCGLSPATDFYALGLVAYYLLSGRHTFEAETSAEILRKQRNEPPPPLVDVAPGVPADVASVVHWCLEKEPAKRPADGRALRRALASCTDASRWDADEASAWWAKWRARPVEQEPPRATSLTAPESSNDKDRDHSPS